MRRLVLTFVIVLLSAGFVQAIENLSFGLGINYLPTSKLEIGEFNHSEESTYDNVFYEGSLFLGLPANFRVGPYYSYYKKTVAPDTPSETDASIWGIGVISDYGYVLTKSGSTEFVFGVESGYGQLSENNLYLSRSTGSVWIGGFGGLRFNLSPIYQLEIDYMYRISNYDFTQYPHKRFEYTGSSLRLTLNYRFFMKTFKEES